MYQAFLINVLIIALIMAVVAITNNPLAIMGLMLLQAMPFIPPGMYEPDEPEEDESQPMGFTADLK